jgi:hypothetical protein
MLEISEIAGSQAASKEIFSQTEPFTSPTKADRHRGAADRRAAAS